MDSFLLGSDYGLSIPTDTPDAWDNYKPTYCWMDQGSFAPKDSLLTAYMNRQDSSPPLAKKMGGKLIFIASQTHHLLAEIANLTCLLTTLVYVLPGSCPISIDLSH